MSAVSKTQTAWNGAPPEWVAVLARECDAGSQVRAARRIGYSASVVNVVIANKYTGNLARVERAVRIELMPGRIACPVLGEIDEKLCLSHRASPRYGNHVVAELARACPRCPHGAEVDGGEGR